MVTLISVVLKLETPTLDRYIAIGIDLVMMVVTLILRFTIGKLSLFLIQM